MNTKDIRDALASDRYAGRVFRGVGPRESFTRGLRKRKGGVYVFNTHYSYEPGEHWVCGRVDEAGVDLFDSFGRHPLQYAPDVWAAAVERVGEAHVFWNDERVQGMTTNVCGDYCTLYALLLARGWEPEDIVDRLLTDETDAENRDHAVRRFVIRRYGEGSLSNMEEGEGEDGVHVQGTTTLFDALQRFLELALPSVD